MALHAHEAFALFDLGTTIRAATAAGEDRCRHPAHPLYRDRPSRRRACASGQLHCSDTHIGTVGIPVKPRKQYRTWNGAETATVLTRQVWRPAGAGRQTESSTAHPRRRQVRRQKGTVVLDHTGTALTQGVGGDDRR